jgi:hypothetical protein
MDASGFGRIGEAAVNLIMGLTMTCVIFVPLGLWKLAEIVVWLASPVSLSVH